MSIGLNVDPNVLWKCRYHINTPDGGLNFSLHKAEANEAAAQAAFVDIAQRLLAIMPSTCEIFACTMSKDDVKKDGRIIAAAIGKGMYLQSGVSPAATPYNRFDDCINVRLENSDGSGVTIKIGPVPDTIILGGDMVTVPANVTDGSVAPAALGAQPITYATEFTQLMQSICKNCHHVSTKNHTPGGNYTYFTFTKAYATRVSRKKGGRVFVK